jgi:hypothetical protein
MEWILKLVHRSVRYLKVSNTSSWLANAIGIIDVSVPAMSVLPYVHTAKSVCSYWLSLGSFIYSTIFIYLKGEGLDFRDSMRPWNTLYRVTFGLKRFSWILRGKIKVSLFTFFVSISWKVNDVKVDVILPTVVLVMKNMLPNEGSK